MVNKNWMKMDLRLVNRADSLPETVEPSLVNQQLVSKYRRRLTTLVELQWKETNLAMLDHS